MNSTLQVESIDQIVQLFLLFKALPTSPIHTKLQFLSSDSAFILSL